MELACERITEEEIRQMIGADSLGYMKIEDLQTMVGDMGICKACFDNRYPIDPGK